MYFDENCAALSTGCSPTKFFMGVVGKPEHIFDPNLPPDIVATQGTVEQWTVENRAGENHEFHFHQLHFLVESQNNFELNGSAQSPAVNGQYLDMIQVPYWDGNPSHPYPSVTVLIDFRGPDVGDFVFHCHILNHEDQGRMNIIRVQLGALANTANGKSRTVAANARPAARTISSGSAEVSPGALEIADRVVEPVATEKAADPAAEGHHHATPAKAPRKQ